MAWMYLIIAGLFEIVGVIGIKKVTKDNNWTNNIILIGGFIISFQFLTMALQEIQLSIAYAVWTGIGTLGAAVVGILFLKSRKMLFGLFVSLELWGRLLD